MNESTTYIEEQDKWVIKQAVKMLTDLGTENPMVYTSGNKPKEYKVTITVEELT